MQPFLLRGLILAGLCLSSNIAEKGRGADHSGASGPVHFGTVYESTSTVYESTMWRGDRHLLRIRSSVRVQPFVGVPGEEKLLALLLGRSVADFCRSLTLLRFEII
jgi:hypothetical protein